MSTPRLRRRKTSISLALALAVLAPAASALKTDSDQPLDVSSNYFKTDQTAHQTLLTGAVKLTQGSIKGEADKGTVYQDEQNKIKRVVLEGKPAHMQQTLDDCGGLVISTATKIDYDSNTSVAILTGNAVVVQQTRGEFRGERIVYNTQSGEITSGGEGGPQVTMHMLPQPKNPVPCASAKDAVPAAPKKDATPPAPPKDDKK